MKTLWPLNLTDTLESAAWLDPTANLVRKLSKAAIRPLWLRDLLHGVPLGHPLHPMLVQIPLGAWTAAAVLDFLPGTDRAAGILIGTGLAAAVPAAVTGDTDWTDLHEQQARVGVIHAVGTNVAVGLYLVSLIDRLAGRPVRGKVFGFAGLAAVSIAGYLGGHLAYRQAAGTNHAEDIPHRVPPGWHGIGALAQLPDGQLGSAHLGDVPLLVYRRGESVSVLSDICSHLSGPLHEGELQVPSRQQPGLRGGGGQEPSKPGGSRHSAGSDACVVCPWHQSVFSLRTGEVVHGPATAPQPCFLTRITDGQVEVCLPGAG